MKPLLWDSIDPDTGLPYTFDSANPNLTWDGIREPGDPGYVPPSPPSSSIKNKTPQKMANQDYYPTNNPAQVVWLGNFASKLPSHVAALPLTALQGTNGVEWALTASYCIGSWLPERKESGKAGTAAVQAALFGDPTTNIALPVFTAPDLPAGLAALGKNGALNSLFELVQVIKTSPGYTEAIGMDLGIIGSAKNAPDFATLQPTITAMVAASAVEIGWSWQGYASFLDQLEIQVDRGDGAGWQMLTYDTTPGYNDTFAHPAALTKWKYRAIYRVGDLRVGLWSAEACVTVGG